MMMGLSPMRFEAVLTPVSLRPAVRLLIGLSPKKLRHRASVSLNTFNQQPASGWPQSNTAGLNAAA